jgi:hypothetical protein
MNILPPEPPKETEELNGTFKYLKSNSDQIMYATAYKAITMTENWDYIKNMTDIFDPESDIIYKKIEELGYEGHSGCSFMGTMREMQFIAKYGEQKFKDRYDEYEKRASTDRQIQERRRIIAELENES